MSLLGPMATALAEAQQAMWRSQDIRFVYRSSSALYDCAALTTTLGRVLGELGAHATTRIEPINCVVTRGSETPVQIATLRLAIVSPVLVTPEVRQEAALGESRRVLLERLGQSPLTTAEFPARWYEIDMIGGRTSRLGSEDCELLRQFREQVLAKLAVRVLAHDRSCSMQRLRAPLLKVAVLLPAHVATIGRLDSR